jgi:hypothetical protein
MPPSWSNIVEVSEGNKENVVTGMANLSIADDEGSRKLTGGSNKPNGEQPQFLGGTPCQSILPMHYPQTVPSKPGCPNTDASPLPLTAAPHINTIESLRQELLGKISGQADDIRKLKSSNAGLKSSNTGLILKVNGLTSSNTGLILKVNELTSSNAELTLSNADLLDKVHKLAESNNDMSGTLRSVSRRFLVLCCSSLSPFFSAAY